MILMLAAMPLQARESKHIHEVEDPYTGVKTLSLEIDSHGCPEDHPLNAYSAHVHLIISAMQMQPHQVAYIIATDLVSRHTKLPSAKNATLDTNIDGAVTQLGPGYPKTKHTIRSAWSGRHVQEMVPFDVSSDYLNQLANAKSLEFRVNAKYDSVQRCSDARDLRDLHEFLDAAASY